MITKIMKAGTGDLQLIWGTNHGSGITTGIKNQIICDNAPFYHLSIILICWSQMQPQVGLINNKKKKGINNHILFYITLEIQFNYFPRTNKIPQYFHIRN